MVFFVVSFSLMDRIVLCLLSTVCVAYLCFGLLFISVLYVFRYCVSCGFLFVCAEHCNSIFRFQSEALYPLFVFEVKVVPQPMVQ
jgi:hypothetical protein